MARGPVDCRPAVQPNGTLRVMRIAPSVARTMASDSPASAFIAQAQWLLRPHSVVTSLVAIDDTTVRMVVEDPFETDRDYKEEADRLAADSAMTVLDQAALGVRIIPTTPRHYEGRVSELAPVQLTFATGLPGVQRYDLVPTDLDGDGIVAPGEVTHRIEVDSESDVRQVDWLLRDRFDEGSVEDGPVQVVVPTRPWTAAPSTGN